MIVIEPCVHQWIDPMTWKMVHISVVRSPGSCASPHSFLRWSTSPSSAIAVWSRDMVAPKGGDARQMNNREFLYV